MIRSRLRTTTALTALALGLAVVAGAAAKECHPDLLGTRSLAVSGALTSYGFAKDGVVVNWTRSDACAGSAVWSFQAGKAAKASTACTRTGGPLERVATKLEARRGNTVARVRLAPAGADRADRLDVVRAGRQVASWPLIDRPTRVALYGDLAVLSTDKRHAIYVLRITDGRIAMVGITQPNDRPTIGPAGLLYQDDIEVVKDRDALGNVLDPTRRTVRLLLVPHAALQGALDKVGTARVTHPISGFAMDGPRVAYGVKDPKGACDQLEFWNVPWRFVSVLSQSAGASCLPAHAPGGITGVAIAGTRAMWTTTYGSVTRVLAASIIECVDWVVARPGPNQQVTGLAGDGKLLSYSVAAAPKAARGLSSVGLVPRSWGGVAIARSQDRTLALSADAGRVAALGSRGFVTISGPGQSLIGRVHVGQARAVALNANTVAVLSNRGALNLYDAGTGRLLHSWQVARNASSVDVQYGIAVVTAGRDVYAVNTATGKVAHVFRAATKVAAQIEAPGAAIQFNARGFGYIRFVPMSRLEASTR